MNRKNILMMVVIAFLLILQTNYGTMDPKEIFTNVGDNVQNFFDALEAQMIAFGYSQGDFYKAARAATEAFPKGATFETFTQMTNEGYQTAYNFIFSAAADVPPYTFTDVDAGILQKFFTFLQTCFQSFSTMTPIQQINAFIQISGLYICLEKLLTTTTTICTRIYNLTKMTVTTFMALYNALTSTTDINPNSIPITINIQPAQNTGSAAAPQPKSPDTVEEVKNLMDEILDKLTKTNKKPDDVTLAEGLMIINGSMSSIEFPSFIQSIPDANISDVNYYGNRTMPARLSLESTLYNFPNNPITRSRSISSGWKPTGTAIKSRPVVGLSSANFIPNNTPGYKVKKYGKILDSPEKITIRKTKGGRKRTKRRKQSKKKTKRRKTTYKRRHSSSRKR